MRIEIDIPAERIADLLTTAIESGDPVTTAMKGGWCDGIHWRSAKATPPAILDAIGRPVRWYSAPTLFRGKKWTLQIVEVDDEVQGTRKRHHVGPRNVREGFKVMARRYPNEFAKVLANEIDAACADIWLQCILFGEEKYA